MPILKDFSGFAFEDKVYSDRFGIGIILRKLSDKEIVVKFSDRTMRFATDDDLDLHRMPIPSNGTRTPMIIFNGERMGRRKMIKLMRKQINNGKTYK